MQKWGATLMGAALLSLTATSAQAYSTSWTRDQAESYAWHGVSERYVYGGDKGWIDNNVWDSSTTEGVDCSSFVPRVYAIDGAGQSYLGEHTAGGHPYNTTSFYYHNVPNMNWIAWQTNPNGIIHEMDAWVWDTTGRHMGICRFHYADYIHTREAECTACGITSKNRYYSDLKDHVAHFFRRGNW